MSYTFNTEKVASLNLIATGDYYGKTLAGVNGTADADDIYKGVRGLFYIAGTDTHYNYDSAIRNLKQSISGTPPIVPPSKSTGENQGGDSNA